MDPFLLINSTEKNILPEIRSIESKLRSIEQGRNAHLNLQQLDSNFTCKAQLWANLNKTKQPVLIMVCQQYTLEF